MDKYRISNRDKRSKRFTEEFKKMLCEEYVSSSHSKSYLQNKYGIDGSTTLLRWLKKYGYISSEGLERNQALSQSKNKKSSESDELNELRKKLREAELKAEAYDRMIKLAEEKFNIPIRKKSNTK